MNIWRYWPWFSDIVLIIISFMLWWFLHHPPIPWPGPGCPQCGNLDIAAYLGMGVGVIGLAIQVMKPRSAL